MIKTFQGGVKVDHNTKPLSYSKRVQPDLHIGYDYYVSFTNNNVYPCTLLEIINEFDKTEVKIGIPVKSKSKKGFIDGIGNRSFYLTQTNIVYATEIGLTPIDAVKNQVG